MGFDQVLRRAEQALVGLDSKTLVSLYAPDFLFEDTTSGDRISDKKDLKAYFDRLFSLPDVSFLDVRASMPWARGQQGNGPGVVAL